jgi:hypothetical protein
LLGLDPVALAKAENIKENFEAIRQRAAKLFSVEEDGDQRILLLGDEVWPFPFPLRKGKDGKWASIPWPALKKSSTAASARTRPR